MNLEIIYYSLFIIRLCWTFFFFEISTTSSCLSHNSNAEQQNRWKSNNDELSWLLQTALYFVAHLSLSASANWCRLFVFFLTVSPHSNGHKFIAHSLSPSLFRRFRPFRPFNTFEQLSTFEKKERKYLFIINWAGLDYCRDWRLIYWHLKRSSLLGTHGMFARVFSSPSPSLFDQTDTHM